MILAKCARKTRVRHVSSLTGEAGLAFTLGLAVLPKAAHLATCSLRARGGCNVKLLSGWSGQVGELRSRGLTTGQDGFNCNYRAICHHDADAHVEGVSGRSLSRLPAQHGEITESGSNSPIARTPLSATC